MTVAPTLVCVHAHPDDEALFTAGVTSHYADLGYRIVLITCTNGQLGLDDHARPGSDPLHDAEVTRATRAGELQRAAIVAGFSRVVTLGYDDSGMKGWSQNDRREAFVNADVTAVARTIAAVMDEENASVVVTYDENGFYGHPDHIMANVVTRAALELATSPKRLYYPVAPKGVLERFVAGARALEYQAAHTEVWRDAVNDWFHRTSGIKDGKNRVGVHPGRTEAEAMKLEGYTVRNITPWETASGGRAIICPIAKCTAGLRYDIG